MTVRARVADALAAAGVEGRLMVAASGGVDSTVLLHTLVALGVDVVAAHVDHSLRSDSADDGAFVAALATSLGVPWVRRTVAVGEGNVQAEARRARYAALAEAAREQVCVAVATGHTATDQAETVLLALARGAGLRGLAGMPPVRPLAEGIVLARPLLQSSRAEVEAVARQRGWAWREDPSNATDRFTRNRLRHTALPALRAEGGAGVDRRIAASADAARSGLAAVREQFLEYAGGDSRLALAVGELAAELRDAILAEAVAEWSPHATRSRALVSRLGTLLHADVGASVDSGGLRVWREPDALRFEIDRPPASGALVETALDGIPTSFGTDPWSVAVDADAVEGATVRTWRPGDRIAPLGLSGSRPVADVLREGGVARADRAHAPVVVAGGRVAWVVGLRLAGWAAVTAKTRRAIQWSWHADGGPG
ncbi:tRNA lysidine(34) synthetase TilS [Rubrivirga sp. IMCC45206]|uniref:tRNA lysidine(34) synthetase TilS n=1 Tax=Rubrivirga sp. IMCC45206 TaxID=3391614 RepID=UPI00398FF849